MDNITLDSYLTSIADTIREMRGDTSGELINAQDFTKYIKSATPKYYNVDLSVTPAGSGTVSGTGSHMDLTNINISTAANEGYRFSKWSDGSTDQSRVISVDGQNINLIAEYNQLIKRQIYTLGSDTRDFNYGNGCNTKTRSFTKEDNYDIPYSKIVYNNGTSSTSGEYKIPDEYTIPDSAFRMGVCKCVNYSDGGEDTIQRDVNGVSLYIYALDGGSQIMDNSWKNVIYPDGREFTTTFDSISWGSVYDAIVSSAFIENSYYLIYLYNRTSSNKCSFSYIPIEKIV